MLHEVLSQRKVRTWAKSYETIMMRYIELCVELKDHHRGKDGLHQYRNLSQAQAPGSLEAVIVHFLNSAEAKLTEAASTAEAAVEEAEAVADLETGGSPESLMMSTMTEEGERQRSERKLLVPWLIFVWETYRAVLDILRSSSKLEVLVCTCMPRGLHSALAFELLRRILAFLLMLFSLFFKNLAFKQKLNFNLLPPASPSSSSSSFTPLPCIFPEPQVVYHKTAHRAFDFCDKFKRKVEFRRLCEMLRTHLGNLSKAGFGPVAVPDKRLRGWDGWTDESVEMHLTTRFKQLEVTKERKEG